MRSLVVVVAATLLIAGCAKQGGKPKGPTSASVLAEWATGQLDLRTWRSCARSAIGVDLATVEIVLPVDESGNVGTLSIEPRAHERDPGVMCLGIELRHPPETVPASGEAHTVRLIAGSVHELPGG